MRRHAYQQFVMLTPNCDISVYNKTMTGDLDTIRRPKMPREHQQVTLGTIYHPPVSDDWAMLNHIIQSLDYICRHHPYTSIVIMGDFNKIKDSHLKRTYNLKQIVELPTRGNSILDNIYNNVPNFYQRPVNSATIGLCDDKVDVCIPSTSLNCTTPVISSTPFRSYKPRDRALFAVALQTTLCEKLFRHPSCEEQLHFFNYTTKTLLDLHLLERQIRRSLA